MTFAERMIPELDGEMARTRKVLVSIPADKMDWRAGSVHDSQKRMFANLGTQSQHSSSRHPVGLSEDVRRRSDAGLRWLSRLGRLYVDDR